MQLLLSICPSASCPVFSSSSRPSVPPPSPPSPSPSNLNNSYPSLLFAVHGGPLSYLRPTVSASGFFCPTILSSPELVFRCGLSAATHHFPASSLRRPTESVARRIFPIAYLSVSKARVSDRVKVRWSPSATSQAPGHFPHETLRVRNFGQMLYRPRVVTLTAPPLATFLFTVYWSVPRINI